MSRSVRIFLACSMGALIGTFIGLSHEGILWRIGGVLLGAALGYVIVDFGQLRSAIPYAWNRAGEVYNKTPEHGIEMSLYGYISIVFGFVILVNFQSILNLNIVLNAFNHPVLINAVFHSLCFIGALISIIFGAAGAGLGMAICTTPYRGFKEDVSLVKKLFKFLNPVVLPVSLICAAPVGVIYAFYKLVAHYKLVVKELLKVGKFAARFLWVLFCQIHSDIRVLCLVDAGIGAVLGIFYFKSPVLGAFAGGLLGLVNYEIVSKRILHLVPIQRRD